MTAVVGYSETSAAIVNVAVWVIGASVLALLVVGVLIASKRFSPHRLLLGRIAFGCAVVLLLSAGVCAYNVPNALG